MADVYDNPIRITYRFAALSVAAVAVIARFQGPVGRVGRLKSFTWIVTTGITVTAPVVRLGTAATPALVLSKTMAIAAANLGGGLTAAEEATAQGASVASPRRLSADTVAQLDVLTAATAGAADFIFVIDWY